MRFLVPSPQKLLAFLQGRLGNHSGKFYRKVLEASLCRINGSIERFGSTALQKGDVVELAPDWENRCRTPRPLAFPILYEDPFLKIVDKPSCWVCRDEKEVFGPQHYLVHRLDKETTGLLIVAKSRFYRDQLMELFEKREIEKQYLALVDGVPQQKEGVCKSLLVRKRAYQGQTVWGSSPHRGLVAITHWKVLEEGDRAALVLCEPKTGRTHQIRVHMAEMGHPLLVDRQYARSFRSPLFFQRPLLHAYRLQFTFQGKTIDVTAPLPSDFCEALDRIREIV